MEISPETAQLVKEYLRRGGRQAQNELSMLVDQDPELRDALSQLWTADERMGLQKEKQAQGQKLQATPMPEGRTAGRFYVASDPSESIRAAFHQARGGIEEQQAQQQMADILREKGATNQAFNKFKQGQAANALRTMTQDREEEAAKGAGELIPGSLEDINYAPGNRTPVNQAAFEPDVWKAGSSQGWRGPRAAVSPGAVPGTPGAGANIGVAPVPKRAFPKPEAGLDPAEMRIRAMLGKMHPSPVDVSSMLVRGGG